MKKFFVLLLVSVILILSVGCQGNGETDASHFEYEEVSGGLKITKYSGSSDTVVIPSVIDDKKVIALSEEAFSGNVKLKEITLPDTFSTVYFFHFKNCESLKKITYFGNVSSIYNANSTALNEWLSSLPSLQSLEFHKLEEKVITEGIKGVIKASETLKNIVIHEITEFENRDFGIGFEGPGALTSGRHINITMPESIVAEYLKKTPYQNYEFDSWSEDEDSKAVPINSYTLANKLGFRGKKISVSDKAKKEVLDSFYEYFNFEITEYSFISGYDNAFYLEGEIKIDGENYCFSWNAGAFYYEEYEKGVEKYSVYGDSSISLYKPIEDSAKMCFVFSVDNVTVNGVNYRFNSITAK